VQAVWYLKCRALTLKNWIDDTEIEEEGVAEVLMDDNAIAQCPRPGTSLARPMTSVSPSSHHLVRTRNIIGPRRHEELTSLRTLC
jgi:tetratricopeptide repeat protein 8